MEESEALNLCSCEGRTGRRCRVPVIWPGVWCGRCANWARLHQPDLLVNPPDAPWVTDPNAGPLTRADIDLLIGERRPTRLRYVAHRDVDLAQSPDLDAETLEVFARRGSLGVRRAVARRAGLPDDVIRALSVDEEADVRIDLARNPHLALDELWRQARQGDWMSQASVAGNPSAPPTLLWWLAAWQVTLDHTNPSWGHLATNPLTPAGLVGNLAAAGSYQALAHPSCPPGPLAAAAISHRATHRSRAAAHPNTPPAALAALAADPEEHVRAAAAANPNCPRSGQAAAGLLAS